MRITAGRILAEIAPNVGDAGVCITNPKGLAQAIVSLNTACKALHKRVDQDFSTLWHWAMPVRDQCFALPEDCLEGRQMWINGFTATQHDEWYQGKLCSGMRDPGSIRYGPEITDLGQYAIPHRLAELRDTRIALVAQSDADAGKQVTYETTNEYGETKRETVTLLGNQTPVVSESQARDVVWLEKPRTQDNVKLYQHFPTNQIQWVCDYSPSTIVGSYRRKKIPQQFCDCQMVTIKGKRKYQEIESENDICPFDDVLALSMAVSAIAAMRRQDMGKYNELLASALNEINKQMKDGDSPSNVSQGRFRSGWGSNPSQGGGNSMPGTSLYGRWGVGV